MPLQIRRVTSIEDPELREALWKLYSGSMSKIAIKTPYVQSLGRRQFMKALTLNSFIKYIAEDSKGLVGMNLIATDLRRVPWLRVDYFRVNHPTAYTNKEIYYVVGLVTDINRVDRVSVLASAKLVQAAIDDVSNPNALFCYDFSETLHKTMEKFGFHSAKENESAMSVVDRLTFLAGHRLNNSPNLSLPATG